MIYFFRADGRRYVYDSGSGAISEISALSQKMLSYLKPPLTSELPTSLRYDLAKFDSGAVEDAYEALYSLYASGKLYTDDNGDITEEQRTAERDAAVEAFKLKLTNKLS